LELLHRRKKYIQSLIDNGAIVLEQGMTVENLPITCKRDYQTNYTSEELTAVGRQVLREIRVNEDQLAYIDKDLQDDDFAKILSGIVLEDGEIKADELSFVNEGDFRTIGLEIHSGKNRIVRRIFDALGYHVVKLDRVYFAGLTKKNLPRGKWRYLSEMEVTMLKMSASAFKG
jgi:pseudouridine synthase